MAAWKIDLYNVSHPLHEAAVHSNEFSLEELLTVMKDKVDNGASVNGLDSRSCTPLGLCVRLAHEPPKMVIEGVVKFLLQHKADPNHRDAQGQTLLHLAAWHGDLQFVKLCVQCGKGDIHARDAEGRKPVDLAAIRGHTQVMEYLDTHSNDLRSICRQVIFEAMGKNFSSKLHCLPLPPQVKLFLSYHIPYPGFEAVIVPPAPWTKEEVWQKKAKSGEVKAFIMENASSEFLDEHRTVLEAKRVDKQSDELVRLFQDMYLWESFKTVNFEEPLLREPRYSMTKVEKKKSTWLPDFFF